MVPQTPWLQVATTNSTSTTTAATTAGASLLVVLIEVGIIVLGAIVIGTILSTVVRTISLRAGASKAVANSLRQLIWVVMIVGVIVGVASVTGITSDITTLTISGIGGLAISLALQNTLSNVIAGVFLLNDGFIRLGDDVQYGGPGGVRGVVVKLSLRTTWIRTADGVITVIGNSNLSSGPILNYTAKARLERKLPG
jgi:small conductance mechanosensitive channel